MATKKKPAAKKQPLLKLVKNDPWLEPFNEAIQGRYDHVMYKLNELTGGKGSLSDFAGGHLYFGLHRIARQWVLREWAPNATKIYVIGEFMLFWNMTAELTSSKHSEPMSRTTRSRSTSQGVLM